jgi:hypothetical protein
MEDALEIKDAVTAAAIEPIPQQPPEDILQQPPEESAPQQPPEEEMTSAAVVAALEPPAPVPTQEPVASEEPVPTQETKVEEPSAPKLPPEMKLASAKTAGKMKAAVVVLTIGTQRWKYEAHFLPSIKAYAKKWGFDFIQLTDMLDTTLVAKNDAQYMKQAICMQKCLIASAPWAEKYDVLIYMDADILVNVEMAPNILDDYAPGKIGAVDERNMFGNCAYVRHVWKTVAPAMPQSALEYYHKFFPGQDYFPRQFNAGVLVFQPSVHASFFKGVYDKYMPLICAGRDVDGDQGPLNYEANKLNYVQYLDERWNRLWNFCWILFYGFLDEVQHRDILRAGLKQIFDTHYFVHFAGGCGWSLL